MESNAYCSLLSFVAQMLFHKTCTFMCWFWISAIP